MGGRRGERGETGGERSRSPVIVKYKASVVRLGMCLRAFVCMYATVCMNVYVDVYTNHAWNCQFVVT